MAAAVGALVAFFLATTARASRVDATTGEVAPIARFALAAARRFAATTRATASLRDSTRERATFGEATAASPTRRRERCSSAEVCSVRSALEASQCAISGTSEFSNF